jgi:hypothetical protein
MVAEDAGRGGDAAPRPVVLTCDLPPEVIALVIDRLPLECTPSLMATCKSLAGQVLLSRESGMHSPGFKAKRKQRTQCTDCRAWHLRSRLRQCDGCFGQPCDHFVCPGVKHKGGVDHCGTRCTGGCERNFCFDCFADMHSSHEERLAATSELVREHDGDAAADQWWRRTNAYFREETPLFIEGRGWVCLDCATGAIEMGYHQMDGQMSRVECASCEPDATP